MKAKYPYPISTEVRLVIHVGIPVACNYLVTTEIKKEALDAAEAAVVEVYKSHMKEEDLEIEFPFTD